MNTIAFLWVGNSTLVPDMLVSSIRLTMGQSIEVIQLTDQKTPAVQGVTSVQRLDLSSHIMVARLQAYAQIKASGRFIFFCDADSIFINPLDLFFPVGDVLLTKRMHDRKINDQFPEFYPEFSGKMFGEIMPYMFGAIAVRDVQCEFFESLLDICLRLPERFHRWYGDQCALATAVTRDNFNFGLLDSNRHMLVVKSGMTSEQLKLMSDAEVQMITFKAEFVEPLMKQTLKNLRDNKMQSILNRRK